MNALLNYPGSKWGMAAQIVSLMPPHRSYLEPFFGSGAVLFNKPPSAIETVNDIDGDIVNFFTVLREQPEELADMIALTPYSRDVFDDAHANRAPLRWTERTVLPFAPKWGMGSRPTRRQDSRSMCMHGSAPTVSAVGIVCLGACWKLQRGLSVSR